MEPLIEFLKPSSADHIWVTEVFVGKGVDADVFVMRWVVLLILRICMGRVFFESMATWEGSVLEFRQRIRFWVIGRKCGHRVKYLD